MKFQEADAKMAELFPGIYRSISYKLITISPGKTETECMVYIDPSKIGSAPTFQAAIDKLMKKNEEPQDIDDEEG